MAAIKRFFEKQKLKMKFKQAGEGHRLTDDTRRMPVQTQPKSKSRQGPSFESSRAGEAALSRMEQPMSGSSSFGTSQAAIKSQVRRELEAEKKALENAERLAEAYAPPTVVEHDSSGIAKVRFRCHLVADVALPKEEMETYIHEYLLSQLGEEPQMTSALMIATLNKNPQKVQTCLETVSKYLDNLISSPREEKFRKIRLGNKAFIERVYDVQGSQEFLQAAGFEMKKLPGPSGEEEDFYVISEELAMETEKLRNLKDILLMTEPIKPELDRGIAVFHPTPHAARIEIPREFYNISPEEIKREQQMKQEAAEKLGMLRTKEMRERERIRELRRYRYCLIRVRFPDGIVLQGTFKAHEKLSSLLEFVREQLETDWIPFNVSTSTGQKLIEETATLAELGLSPAAVVNFTYDSSVLAEVTAQKGSQKFDRYLKRELLARIRSL